MRKLIPLLPLVLLAACGGHAAADDNAAAAASDNGGDEAADKGGDAGAEAKPDATATVRTAVAAQGATGDTVAVYGVAEAGPGNEHALTVQAEAVMAQIVAPTGTAVRTGQVVAILRPSPTSRVEASKAASDAAAANAAYARAKRLRADGLASDADVETARAAADTANVTLRSTSARGATLTLRAPASGTVQNLSAKPGDTVAAGTAVATIGTSGSLRARFGIDPALAQRVHPGQPIQLAAINGGTPATATVSGVDPQVDATTRLAAVFAPVPAGAGVGAGEPLRGSIGVGGSREGITIPYAALLDDGGRSFVFVVANGVARKRDVSPGSSAGDRIAVLRGLRPGERVVTEGGTALDDGMKVTEAGGGAK